MIVKVTLFRKLQTVKDLIKPLSKKYRFWRPFESQHVKGCQALVKSVWEHFHYILSSLWGNLACKKCSLSIPQISGVFHNTLTSNEKYPFQDIENLFHFWNLHQILNSLKKKMIVTATFFRKLQTVKDLVRPFPKRHRFRTIFENQHVKRFETLVKPPWEHFHHIFSSLWENLIWNIPPLVIC